MAKLKNLRSSDNDEIYSTGRRLKETTKMKHAKLGLIALMAMLAVLMATSVFAVDAVTFRNPSAATQYFTNANDTVTTQTKVNVTTSGNVNISNCSLWFYATDTNETAASPVLVKVNSTGNQTNTTTVNATEWTFNVSGPQFQDTNNGVFNVSCESYNVSANTPVSTTQSVRIDHGMVPDQATGTRPQNNAFLEQNTRTVSFSGSVNATETTHCYVDFVGRNPGRSRYSSEVLGATATNCTITIANFPEGSYKFVYAVSDGINETASPAGVQSFTVLYLGGVSKVGYVQATQQQAAQQTQQAKQSNMKNLVIIIAAIVIITQIMKKGGKKR